MAVVTEEMRETQIEQNRLYHERVKKQDQEAADRIRRRKQAEQDKLTTLDLLLQMEATKTVNMVFRFEGGDRAIPIRIMPPATAKQCIQLIMKLGVEATNAIKPDSDEIEAITGIGEAFDEVLDMAASLVADPDIARGFSERLLSYKLGLEVIQFSLKQTVAIEETGTSFRLN